MSEFKLGFSIDTTALKQAATEGAKAAEAIGKLGDAETKLGQSGARAAEGQAKVSAATKDAEASAQRFIRSLEMEARATKDFERSQEALTKALNDGKIGAQQHATMMRQVEESYRKAQREAKEFRDTVDKGGAQGLAEKLQAAGGAIRGTTGDIGALADSLRGGGGLAGGLDAAGGLLARFGGGLGAAGLAAAGAAAGVGVLTFAYFEGMKALAEYEDKMARLEGRLRNSLGSTAAAREAIDALYKSTQKTGLGFDAAADAFARISRNNDAIGLTQKQMLQMVDTVQKLGAVSGASAGEMAGGMIQFGQALASGRLQGDELRSIMENFPALAKAIADNFETADGRMGVSIGTLRRMGSEGELTSSKIADAVLRAQKQTEEQYKNMPQTMEQANQRIADSYAKMLTNMGRYFQSSEFVQSVYGFLNTVTSMIGGMFDKAVTEKNKARIAEIDATLKRGYDTNITGSALSTFGRFIGLPVPNVSPISSLSAADRAALQKEREGLVAVTPMTAAQQAEADRIKKLDATSSAADSIVQQNLGLEGQRRKIKADLRSINESLTATQELLKQPNLKPEDAETLRKTLVDQQAAADALGQKLRSVGAKARNGADGGKTALQSLLDTIDDTISAIAQGGGGGGTSIYEQAITSQRADAEKGRAAALGQYVDALTRKAVQAANETITQLDRQTNAQKAMTATVGQSADVIRDAEIAQAAADFQYEKFGKITTPATTKAVEDYTAALRRNRTQMDLNKQTQEALNATERAAAAWEMNNAEGNPREQRRIKFENDLNNELKNKFGNPDKLTADQLAQRTVFENGRRSEFLAGEAAIQDRITREQQKQLDAAKARLGVAHLLNDQYEIQMRLISYGKKLEAEGYKPGDGFYEQRMATERSNAVQEQQIAKQTDARRKFIGQWEKSADQIQDLFGNAFDTIFTEGVSKAGSIFAKGFGQIIKDLSAQMIYELAYRPLAEMATNFAKQLGQNFASAIFGVPKSAKGSYFAGSTYDFAPFAMGGVFTNSIVDQPTMFAFAKGGALGLMGEAGPEAIMPLKRDGNGRLGVSAQGSGGDVQVVVNDMRSSPGAEQVETKSSRGPDGKRMISVMIRDEMRRQLRSGDLDRDMAANYGNSRTLARK